MFNDCAKKLKKVSGILFCIGVMLIFSMVGCGEKEIPEATVKDYVEGLVDKDSVVTVTRIQGNEFEVHFTYDYPGFMFVGIMGTEESKAELLELFVKMIQSVEKPLPSWFRDVHGEEVKCKVYVDITDSELSEMAGEDAETVYYTIDSNGTVKNSSGEIFDF